jgi:hypothetical protein
VFDPVSDPNAEGSSTAGGTMSVAAEDTSSSDCFDVLVLLIVAPQEPVFDQCSDALAMRARGRFELCQQLVDILLGRTDPTPHDKLSPVCALQILERG